MAVAEKVKTSNLIHRRGGDICKKQPVLPHLLKRGSKNMELYAAGKITPMEIKESHRSENIAELPGHPPARAIRGEYWLEIEEWKEKRRQAKKNQTSGTFLQNDKKVNQAQELSSTLKNVGYVNASRIIQLHEKAPEEIKGFELKKQSVKNEKSGTLLSIDKRVDIAKIASSELKIGLTTANRLDQLHEKAPEELAELEQSLISEGNRVPIDTWNGYIVDGHNRYDICHKRGILLKPPNELKLPGREDVLIWIIRNQFGRRNLLPHQRARLALTLEDIFRKKAKEKEHTRKTTRQKSDKSFPIIDTKKELAKIAGVSHDTIAKGVDE